MKNITFLLLIICLQSCHYGRMIRYYKADIDDHKIFPYTEVNIGENTFYFEDGSNTNAAKILDTLVFSANGNRFVMDKILDDYSETTAFLVIKNDAIVFEKYYEGYKRDSISNIFSVSKSVTSLLVGIAIEEGKLESIHDPITKYIPELNEADPLFKKLTLEHLLDMRSGLAFSETYSSPFDEVSRLYYGKQQLKQISNMEFNYEPGTHHEYQSVCTTLLGIAIERVTGMRLGKYLEAKLWIPLEMENPATWSYDDEKNKNTKAFCCLNTTAIDLAKIARLMIHKGEYNGKQIVSKQWVEKLTTPNKENDCYQYQWYSKDCAEDFYALGILGQQVYISPSEDLIIVRLGKSWTSNNVFISRIKEVLQE
ncbi:serine hydrolase [Dokdonia sp.]|uniref:serine hydrolase domain-containing protein n=1 Tax=Dokdonia sp. TaxID=2024995 RepID=UPI003266F012